MCIRINVHVCDIWLYVIYGCSQPRELWFIDFNHVVYITYSSNTVSLFSAIETFQLDDITLDDYKNVQITNVLTDITIHCLLARLLLHVSGD